ncbi:MAG: hypothetical protein ABI273_00055 [Lacunisphaera sp.]
MSFPPSFIRAARKAIRASSVAFVLGTFTYAGIGELLGTTTTTTTTSSPVQNPPFPYAYIPQGEGAYQSPFSQSTLSQYSDPLPVSFSFVVALVPQPPALGEMLVTDNILVPQTAVELSLADCRGETFFMAYANLLQRKSLSEKRTQRINDYLAARHRLVDELRASMDELKDKPSAVRAPALALLATREDGSLHALESEAEAIRQDLTSHGPLSFKPIDSGEDLAFMVRTISDKGTRDYFVLMAAAQYVDGFSTEQRLLLHEMAFEAEDREASAGNTEKSVPEPYLYFLPATARIHLPENVPPLLDAKVKAFLAEKERLKAELLDAIHPSHFLPRQRTDQIIRLAEQQAPQFIALESLAEEIRTGMAGLPYPDKPDRSTLPEDLTRRVGTFGVLKAEVQRELFHRLRTLNTEKSGTRFQIVRQGDGLAIVPTNPKEAAPPALAAFNADLARRYTAMTQESKSLRHDIQQLSESDPHYVAHTVKQLAADFGQAYTAQENWNRYHDYFLAVLEPGLSPAQRRLLFAATLSDFARAGYWSQP